VGAAVAAAVALLPLVYLVVRATERGWAGVSATLRAPNTVDLTLASIELAVVVTLACLVVGTALAWLVTRTDLPFRRVWQVAAALPLALPSYVAAYAWIGWDDGLAGLRGSAIVLTTVSYPYVYLPVMAALRSSDPALEDAARTLGLRPWAVFWRVTLPQVRPAAVGGGLLVGLYALSDFGAVSVMRHDVLTRAIYNSYRSSFDRTPAAVLGCILALLAIAVVVAESRFRGRGGAVARSGAGARRLHATVALGPWRYPAVLVPVAVLAVALGIPARGLDQWFRMGTSRPEWDRFGDAAVNTLQVGALGALAVVALAFPVALLTVRHPGPLARLATRAAYAGHALPGVVVGLSLVFFGIRWAGFAYQELPMLIAAYVVLYLSLALGGIQAGIAAIPPVLDDVARTLGRNRWGVWWSVTARLAAPGIGAAATLVFLTIMKELPATLFLRPTGFDTLATGLWAELSSFSKAAAAPYAAAIVLIAALPTALLATIGDRRRPR
jgi:iron(III) transport system permease protein